MLNNLPNTWQVVEFGSVLNGGTRNGIYKQQQFRGSGFKMVNMGELFAYPRLRDVPMSRIQLTDDEAQRFGLKVGDLLFARRSLVAEGAGKCSIVCEINEPLTFESSIIRARPNSEIADSLFLYYLFNSAIGSYLLDTILRHVAVAGITGTDLVKLKIPLPPLPEQRVIAEILGALDDKIELNRRMNRTLESMARVVFRQWFVEGEEVEDWEVASLSSICESIFSGGTPSTTKPEYWNGVIPWLSSGETRDRFIIGTEKTITQAGVDNSSTRFARSGSTVIASAGQGKTRGQTSLLMFDSYINQSVVVLNANKKLISDLFLFFGLSGRYEEFRQLSDSHSSRGSLTTKLLGGLQISVPPFEKVLEFDKFAKPIVEQINQNLRQSRTLASLRDSLLPKLMRGEVRVSAL